MSRLPASLLRLRLGSLSPLLLVDFCVRQRTVGLFFAVALGRSAFLTAVMKLISAHRWRRLWLRLVADSDVSCLGGHAVYSLAPRQPPRPVFWRMPRFAPGRRPAPGVGPTFSRLGVSWPDLETHFLSEVWAVWRRAPAWVPGVCALTRPYRQGSQAGSPDGSGGQGGSLDLLGTAQ